MEFKNTALRVFQEDLNYSQDYVLSPSLEKMLPNSLFLPTQYKTNRCSIFSTFSKVDYKNLNIVNYIKNKADIKKISSLKKMMT